MYGKGGVSEKGVKGWGMWQRKQVVFDRKICRGLAWSFAVHI